VSACDLKIITKALSIRVAKVLPDIIISSQMGFVPGRDINFNNRILRYIVLNHDKFSENVVASFDAEKAFDSVSHDYLIKVLEIYGFPVAFIKVFKLLYSNNTALVQVHGHLSKEFRLQRGVKQGDALSCSLFVLAVDPLLRNIEANSAIQGAMIGSEQGKCTVKTLAYADDVAVVTSVDSLQEVFFEYERLYRASGLRLNAEKTEILFLNRIVTDINVEYLDKQVPCNSCEVVKICGNYLCLDDKKSYELNVTKRIENLAKILNSWKSRNLTIVGKMLVVKTFALSQLVFSSQFVNISAKDIKKIEKLCYGFLWGEGPERVKRAYLKNSRINGGINGVDVEAFFLSIQIRQFIKAERSSCPLRIIQHEFPAREDIAKKGQIWTL